MSNHTAFPILGAALALTLIGCGGGGGSGSAATGSLSGNLLGSPTPVSGAKVVIEELGIETRSSAQGFFKFEGVPVGSYTVMVDGSEVFDPNDNSAQLPRKAVIEFPSVSVTGNGAETTLNGRPVFLPTLDTGTQIDTNSTVSGTIPAGTVIANADLGVSLVFEQATAVTFKDASDTTISVSEVPIGEIPMNLPAGQISSSVVTLQPPGATFSPGAKVIFPNWDELPAGTTNVALYRFDHDAGDWVQFGTGTVDAEGARVISDDGSELSEAGWNGPTTPVVCTTTVTGRIVDGANPTTGVEGIVCTTINGQQTTSAADGTFSFEAVPVPRPGFQVLVYGAPLAANSGFGANVSDGTIVVCGGTTDVGDIVLPTITADTTAPTVSTIAPADAATEVSAFASVRVTLSEDVSPGSVNASTFQVDFGSGPLTGVLGVNGADITFLPADGLPLEGTGTVTLSTGIQDRAGNPLAETFTSRFTTATASGGGAIAVVVNGTLTTQIGQTTQLSAAINDASGAPVLGPRVSWSTADPSIASVSRTGLVRGVSAGSVDITATGPGGISGLSSVTVSAPTVNAVEVSPEDPSVIVGGLRQLNATARDSVGTALPGLDVSWTSSNPSVATIDAAGVVRGLTAGMTTITAMTQSASDTAAVIVIAPSSIASIAVVPGAAQAEAGGTVQFEAIARDGSQNIIPGVAFDWTSSDTSVATISSPAGRATAVADGSTMITANANSVSGTANFNVAQNTTLTIALYGGTLASDPLSGVRILRHNPTTGAFIEEMTTDAAGLAEFGDIGTTTTTFTVYESLNSGSFLRTLSGVPTGTYSLVVLGSPQRSFFDVTLTGAANAAMDGQVIVGDFFEGESFERSISGGTATFANVSAERLQPDGRFSLIATAADPTTETMTGTGWLLDRTFASLDGQSVAIAVNNAPATIPFTATASTSAAGYVLRRRGALFDIRPHWGADPATSGTIPVPRVPGANAWSFAFEVEETASASGLLQERIHHGTLPAAVAVNMPAISLSNLSYDGMMQTLSWTASGADVADVDMTSIEMEYQANITDGISNPGIEWSLLTAGDTASVTLPGLPSNLSFISPPTDRVGFTVELIDLDNASGFADGIRRLEEANGNFAALPFTANTVNTAFRGSIALSVEVSRLSGGDGSVVSTPAGIDTSMGQFTANFPFGTQVDLAIQADSGSFVRSTNCSSVSDGLPTSTSCQLELREAVQTLSVTFESFSDK